MTDRDFSEMLRSLPEANRERILSEAMAKKAAARPAGQFVAHPEGQGMIFVREPAARES